MTDSYTLDIPVTAFTQDVEELTTFAKLLDQAERQARKEVHARESRRLLKALKAQEDRNVVKFRLRQLVKAELARTRSR